MGRSEIWEWDCGKRKHCLRPLRNKCSPPLKRDKGIDYEDALGKQPGTRKWIMAGLPHPKLFFMIISDEGQRGRLESKAHGRVPGILRLEDSIRTEFVAPSGRKQISSSLHFYNIFVCFTLH